MTLAAEPTTAALTSDLSSLTFDLQRDPRENCIMPVFGFVHHFGSNWLNIKKRKYNEVRCTIKCDVVVVVVVVVVVMMIVRTIIIIIIIIIIINNYSLFILLDLFACLLACVCLFAFFVHLSTYSVCVYVCVCVCVCVCVFDIYK